MFAALLRARGADQAQSGDDEDAAQVGGVGLGRVRRLDAAHATGRRAVAGGAAAVAGVVVGSVVDAVVVLAIGVIVPVVVLVVNLVVFFAFTLARALAPFPEDGQPPPRAPSRS